jgi:hypothetical protein
LTRESWATMDLLGDLGAADQLTSSKLH